MNPFLGFGDVSAREFVTRYWDRQPLYAAGIADSPVFGLTAQRICEEYVAQGYQSDGFTSYHTCNASREQGRHAVLSMWHDQRPPTIGQVVEFNRQHSLIVRGAQRYFPELSTMLDQWQPFFNCRLNSNVYLTRPNSSAFGTHYDQHHVVAIQVDGEKDWLLWPPTVDAPHGRYQFEEIAPKGDPLTWRVRAGHALYIPLGWVHRAKTVGESSVHVTIGINPPRWLDLIEQAVDQTAGEYGLLRRSLPLRFSSVRGMEFFADETRHVQPILDLLMENMASKMQSVLEQSQRSE
jgi:ribosomal protein L16 Arg81 hydroxylase